MDGDSEGERDRERDRERGREGWRESGRERVMLGYQKPRLPEAIPKCTTTSGTLNSRSC